MGKFPQKVGPMLSVYMPQFSTSVYGSETIEEYEESWKHALMQHSALENHEWLLQMYKLRKQWVPAFCMHIFSAQMSSSQRVESGHSFFKKYVSKRNSLWDFVTRFERELGHQRHKELVSDHVNVNEVPKLKTLFPIEKQMRGLYTKTIFLKFQDEVIQSTAYLKCDAIREDEKDCVYVVIRADAESSTLQHIVHNKASSFARCSCRKFEFEGIPCRHVFFLRSIHIVDLPSQYIMKRWTKSVKAERVWDGDGLEIKDVQYKSLMMRHIQLSQLSQCLIDESSLMEETTELVRKRIESLHIEVKGLRSSLGVGEVPTKRKLQKHMINELAQVKAKGSGKRMKSSKEKAMGKAKKYKACGGLGHTIR